jgi:hypothetical protein
VDIILIVVFSVLEIVGPMRNALADPKSFCLSVKLSVKLVILFWHLGWAVDKQGLEMFAV